MSKDQIIGALLFLGGIAGIILYFWLVFLSPWISLILEITAFLAVAAVLAIMAWVGYTLATTPPPEPIEEVEKIEEEKKGEIEATKEAWRHIRNINVHGFSGIVP
jgi:predicted DNA-binding transcriptional regulator